MGAACISSRKKIISTIRGDEEPQDTSTLSAGQAQLPQLNFEMKLSNVRLRGVPYVFISIYGSKTMYRWSLLFLTFSLSNSDHINQSIILMIENR
jgi:hypothetical protein